jgi:hypothetical protein
LAKAAHFLLAPGGYLSLESRLQRNFCTKDENQAALSGNRSEEPLRAMQFVPDKRAGVTERIPDDAGYNNQYYSGRPDRSL